MAMRADVLKVSKFHQDVQPLLSQPAAHRTQIDKERAVGELRCQVACHLQAEPGLADASGARQRKQPHRPLTQETSRAGTLGLTTEQRGRRNGKAGQR